MSGTGSIVKRCKMRLLRLDSWIVSVPTCSENNETCHSHRNRKLLQLFTSCVSLEITCLILQVCEYVQTRQPDEVEAAYEPTEN